MLARWLIVAALVLAFPAQALADSAGDNQYQDPFANSAPAPKTKPKSTTRNTQSGSSSPGASSSTPASSTKVPVAHSASSRQLPFTGVDARLIAALGVVLIGGGLLLRRLA